MKISYLFLILLLINSFCWELKEGIKSDCTKKAENENLYGTLDCLMTEKDIYIPYFKLKAYHESIVNNQCKKAKDMYSKLVWNEKFVNCHKKFNVELK